jgi:hypothetical protein
VLLARASGEEGIAPHDDPLDMISAFMFAAATSVVGHYGEFSEEVLCLRIRPTLRLPSIFGQGFAENRSGSVGGNG